MDCICQTLSGIWNFILGSIRLILFCICVLFILAQSVWLVVIVCYKDTLGLSYPETDFDYQATLPPVGLILAGLFGCWATFYKSDRGLRLFAILTATCAVVLVVLIATSMSPEWKEKDRGNYINFLKENAEHYDWKNDGKADDRSKMATKVWDTLQETGCCGIKSASDWNQYRPADIDKEYFPSSCCVSGMIFKDNGLCLAKNGISKTGCLEKVGQFESMHRAIYIGFILLLIFITILSCIYIFGDI